MAFLVCYGTETEFQALQYTESILNAALFNKDICVYLATYSLIFILVSLKSLVIVHDALYYSNGLLSLMDVYATIMHPLEIAGHGNHKNSLAYSILIKE